MDQRIKIFFACAAGAGIGALTALELNQSFWWIGLLVGGLVGYLSYEAKAIVLAVPYAWRKATSWQPDKVFWKEYFKHFGWCLLASSVIGFSLLILSTSLVYIDTGKLPNVVSRIILFVIIFGSCLTLSFFIDCDAGISTGTYKRIVIHFNPIAIYIYYPIRFLLWFVVRIPRIFIAVFRALGQAFLAICRFFKYLFIQIHSDLRLLCAVDAMIGAAIGFFAGSALIGALAGGVFGVLNYEVVSKGLLQLHIRK